MRLYLGNLPYSVNEEKVREFLAPFSSSSVHIPIDAEMKRPRGFAFAEVSDGDGPKVIAERDGTDLDGRRIIVNEAKPKQGGGNSGHGGRGGNRSSNRPDRHDKNSDNRRGHHGKRGRNDDHRDFWNR